MVSLCPSFCHSSSAMCGAYGDNAITNGSSIVRLLHFIELSSLQQIMNSLTEVLNENFSMSSSIFFSVLFNTFSSSRVGSSMLTVKLPALSWKRFQNLRRNLKTPSIPFVFQGLDNSKGPKNISYILKVSAP